MKLLLDTNLLLEATKPQPNRTVLTWLHGLDEDRTFISVISIAGIQRGVALIEDGRRREALSTWLSNDLLDRFEERLLSVDSAVALAWGELMGKAKNKGRGLSTMDGLIAATAIAHDLTLATRNIKDFKGFGLQIVDPWNI